MPKVSDKHLDGQIQEIIISQFIYALTFLESPKQTASFFSDFLTDSETIMFSKRLAIAVLLLRGHSQTLITKLLSVSYSATGAVASWMKNADPASMLVLNTISQNDDWKELVYNYKAANQAKKAQRKTKPLDQSDPDSGQPDSIEVPPEMQSGDFEALEGPTLTSASADDSNPLPTGPSMDDMLENI